MIHMEKTLYSPLPPPALFAYLSDLRNFAQWDPGVAQVEALSEGPPALGSSYRVLLDLGLKKSPVAYRLTTCDPAAGVIVAEGKGDSFTLRDTITISSAGQETAIHWRLELTLSVPWAEPLMRPFMHCNGARGMAALQKALAAPPPAPQAPSFASTVADHMVLPGALTFTRWGYAMAQTSFSPLVTSLAGKVIVITGATSGIGHAAATALGSLGATLVLIGRDPQKGARTIQEISRKTGNEQIRFLCADLTSIEQTLAVGRHVRQEYPRVDVLINNAGALFNERQVTREGYERSFALLLLSPFTLMQELLPSLRAAPRGRIVNVVSGGMYTQPIHLDDLQYERERYNGPKAYARAKRGLLMVTETMAAREGNLRCNAMHPGWVDTPGVAGSLPSFYAHMRPLLRTPAMGADTIVWLAASPQPEDVSGRLWMDRSPHVTSVFPGTAHTKAQRARLWELLSQFVPPSPPCK